MGPRFQVFLANFLLRMRRNGHKTTSSQIFNPKFETPMGCFLFDYEFWGRLLQDLCVFWVKNGFRNENFRNLGPSGGGGDHFLTKPPKGTSLPDFMRFEPLSVQIGSGVFALGEATKKGHYKKLQRRYISPICVEFSTQPNLTKIGIWVGVARRNQPYQVSEWSVKGVQSYRGSNFGLLHRNGLSPITL